MSKDVHIFNGLTKPWYKITIELLQFGICELGVPQWWCIIMCVQVKQNTKHMVADADWLLFISQTKPNTKQKQITHESSRQVDLTRFEDDSSGLRVGDSQYIDTRS